MRVFSYKMVSAPWLGPDATARRVDLGDALRSRPRQMGRVAPDGVFWSEGGNSYVLAEGESFYHPDLDRKVDILSINGCGEVRWRIDPTYDGGISTFDHEAINVAQAFGLAD